MTQKMRRQLHLQDDHMSGNWSLGSNYQPCSQSRKISIGLMVDSVAKMEGKKGKGAVAELQNSQNLTSVKDIPAESKHKGKETASPDLGRQNKAPCQEPSSGVHTKTSYQNISLSDTTGHPKQVSSLPSTSNVLLQPNGNKIVGEVDHGSVFATQMPNLHAKDANEEKSKKNTYQSEGSNHGVMGREKESSHATAEKVIVPEQGTSERGNNGNITLRMKVQELLGTVYSPNKKQFNPETFGMDANNLTKQKPKTNKKDNPVAMDRQHLQAKETNSGSLNHTIRRPVTRSSTGNKPQTQKSVPKIQPLFSRNKQAELDENEFSFIDTWSRRPNTDVSHGSTSSKRKERDTIGTRPVKKSFMEGVHKDETDSRKRTSTAANVSLFENRRGESKILEPNEPKEKTHQKFEVKMAKHQFGGNKGATLFNKMDQDPFTKHPSTNNVDSQHDNLKSPTFELKTGAGISFSHNPSERSLKTKGTCSSHSIRFSKGAHSNATTKNFSTDPQDSPIVKSVVSRSSSKEVESESSEDGSPVTVPAIPKNMNENGWSASPCQEEVFESSEDGSPIKGEGDCEDLIDDSSTEQNGVAGAVKLFALALERVETKIRSSTSRQSAEILLSVSKNIHSELQNAESKIQNQVGKLTELGKSRRMRPEKQWQEQQEQLKRIYEKFKEEVDEHLDKCRRTLQGMEANEVEVRGMVEKQRVSHRKLLLQTEEAIEAQLNDAKTRLADVHRVAKEKMLKLKYGIAECLKQG